MSYSAHTLKAAIDRGATRDKVAFPDPAAAPLGTDEEAAGTPVPEDAASLAYQQEVVSRLFKGRPKRSVVTLVAAVAFLFAIAIGLILKSASLQ